MTTKLEELRQALEAATPDIWETIKYATPDFAPQYGVYAYGEDTDLAIGLKEANAAFIALAHNNMQDLLEAVDLLETLRYSMSQYDDGEWFLHDGADELITKIDDFLERLK